MSYDEDNEDDSQLVLDAIAGRRPNRAGRVRANCPFCEMNVHKVDRKQCLSIEMTSGYWKCFRCEAQGRLGSDTLPQDVETLKPKAKDEKPPVFMPEGFVALWTPDGQAQCCTAARKYLAKDRVAITPEVIAAARIGACVRGRYAGRVVVPIYRAGKLAGFMTRAWRKKHPKPYLYSDDFDRAITLYNEDALYVTTDEPAYIVEGIFDTYPFWRPGQALCDGIAVLGKPSADQIGMMAKARRPLMVVFDGDAHREATALAMELRRHGRRAAALRLPPGVDPDECHEHVKAKAKAVFAASKEPLNDQPVL